MTFREKIINSTIIDERLQRKSNRIKDKKARLKSVLLTLIIVAYTLIITITKIMKLDKQEFFSNFGTDELLILLSFVLIGFKIVFSCIISFTKKSLFQLNHLTFYSIVDACNVLVLVGLFAINIYNYSTILDLGNNWNSNNTFWQNIGNLILKDFFHSMLFYMTIIINIPALFKFLIFSITNGAILYVSLVTALLAPIMVLFYLKRTNRLFFEYTDYDNRYYLIRRRYINKRGYGFSKFCIKVLVISIIFFINFLFFRILFNSMFVIDNSEVDVTNISIILNGNNTKNQTLNLMTYLIPAYITGYLVSIIYFYKSKMENKLYFKCQRQLNTSESIEKVVERDKRNERLDEYIKSQDPNRFAEEWP